jgi:hypothetical protein
MPRKLVALAGFCLAYAKEASKKTDAYAITEQWV